MKSISQKLFHTSEILLMLAGLFVLASVVLLSFTGNFSFWIMAKILYGVGVILFLFSKN